MINKGRVERYTKNCVRKLVQQTVTIKLDVVRLFQKLRCELRGNIDKVNWEWVITRKEGTSCDIGEEHYEMEDTARTTRELMRWTVGGVRK